MTNLGTDRTTYVPTGRPVARFVLVLAVLAVLFGAVWWSGLAAPRLRLGSASHGSYDSVTGRTTATVEIRNSSPAAVGIRAVSLGDGRSTVDSVSVDGRDLAGGSHRLAAGGTATMVVDFTCRAREDNRVSTPGPSPVTRLRVTVRTAVGLERTVTAGMVPLFRACMP